MNKKYDGYILFSDVDGTLMASDWTISQRNLDTLQHFTENGGCFALATGRGLTKRTFDLFDRLPMMNFPCVLLNGALIYDSKKRETIRFFALPDSVKAQIIDINNTYPEWSISICTASDRFQIGPPVEPEVGTARPENITDAWGKVLLHVDAPLRTAAMDWLRSLDMEGVDVTASAETLVEIVPKGISKGFAIEELIGMYGISRAKVGAIGDYDNDFVMLSVEGINTFCPQNAAPKIKAICKTEVCSVYDGAVAEAIEHLVGERE